MYYDILVLTKTPISKSKIFGWCGLNYTIGSEYLSILLEKELIKINETKRHYFRSYSITQKGYEFLKAKDEAVKIFDVREVKFLKS